jgi:integrase
MTMQDHESDSPVPPQRTAWNKGKLIGAKPPLRPKHVWSVRTKLQLEGRTRDLAMFNVAIDSKLRGCDVVALKVEDIAPKGYAVERATVRQKKTGQPVRFELTEQTRQAIDEYLSATSGSPVNFSSQAGASPIEASRRGNTPGLCLTGLQALGLIQIASVRTRFGVPKQP